MLVNPYIAGNLVLLELIRRLPQEGPYQPIYFDLQDKAALPLTTVLRELMQRIASATDVPVPTIANEALPEQFQTAFLAAVLQQLPTETSLILLFDEFDVLDNPDVEYGKSLVYHRRPQMKLRSSWWTSLSASGDGGRHVGGL